jgi:hypothetical protein
MIHTTTVEQVIEHPLEKVFGIETGTTIIDVMQVESEIVDEKLYDEKDVEIENQYENIYNTALLAYAAQASTVSMGADPRCQARNMEVANGFLNTALAAAKEKANLKQQKEKIKTVKSTDTNITNNNLIMDRDELLRIMMKR